MYIKFFITYKKFLIDDIIFFYVNIKFYKRRLTSQVKIKKCAKKVALAFREIFFKRSKCLRNGGNSSNLPFQLVEMRFSWNAHFATNRAGSAALFFGGGPWRSHGSHVRHWCNTDEPNPKEIWSGRRRVTGWALGWGDLVGSPHPRAHPGVTLGYPRVTQD